MSDKLAGMINCTDKAVLFVKQILENRESPSDDMETNDDGGEKLLSSCASDMRL